MVYVIVGFRVDSDKSIYYKKCSDIRELQKSVWYVFEKKRADYVSIRRVRGRKRADDTDWREDYTEYT